MKRYAAGLSLALTLLFQANVTAAKPKSEHVYGPPPSWNEYRAIGEAAVAGRLIDPESARVTWLSGFFRGEFKPFLEPRVGGYVACGRVNAKNRLGGYVGATTFVMVIDYGRALLVDMDARSGGFSDAACAKMIGSGLAPPVPPSTVATLSGAIDDTPATPRANLATGLALRAMPDGAYVAGVVPGSPAAMAGLKPGMVIASVNAIPLAGMGETMLRVVDAAGPTATLAIIGRTPVKLGAGK